MCSEATSSTPTLTSSTATPTLTHVIYEIYYCLYTVAAVTSLGDDVFVVRDNYSQQVEVFDAETLRSQRHIAVRALVSSPRDLTACPHNNCLYMSDTSYKIHRVELSGRNTVKTWSVGRRPAGLSVNIAHNLVVACEGANKLQEYTTHGSLVREICLRGVTDPWHAIQLSTGDYVVSQNTSPGVVSVVGIDGQVIHTYGQSQTSDVGPMNHPSGLAVTRNDNILVADRYTADRILSISRSTGRIQELDLPVGRRNWINPPVRLYLDESRGRLYHHHHYHLICSKIE